MVLARVNPNGEWRNKSKLIRAVKGIAKIVENSISSGNYGNFNQKTKKELSEALEICKDYKYDYDAVLTIKKYVFDAPNGLIVTRNCPKLEKFFEQMRKMVKR